ncbi:hypothetical protein ACFE04_017852 [Oxalis oulophora]
MSLVVDHQQQSNNNNNNNNSNNNNNAFKYYCKICQKGFLDGRALGGHMKAHGVLSDLENGDYEDPTSDDWDDNVDGTSPVNNKHMYALRTNPNRLKRCRDCSNCGKEFTSGKSFLEHSKCGYDDVDDHSLASPLGSDEENAEAQAISGWSKRKRSLRATIEINDNNINIDHPSNEEQDLANCLMMLSNSTGEAVNNVTVADESYASASKGEEQGINNKTLNFVTSTDNATAIAASFNVSTIADIKGKSVVMTPKGMFECKACKKVFSSHQALGGHRASHKKVKGCFAAKLDQEVVDDINFADDQDATTNEELYYPPKNNNLNYDCDDPNQMGSNSKKKSKVHQCSICNRVFSSGQALGGHKRCHWITSSLVPDTSTASLVTANYHHLREQIEQQIQQNSSKFINNSEPLDLTLDLNLPAPIDQQPSSFADISTKIHLPPWVTKEQLEENNQLQRHDELQLHTPTQNIHMEDKDDNNVKLPKLSELKDMNINGASSSPWLQVGIGTSTNDQMRGDCINFCKAKGLDICP